MSKSPLTLVSETDEAIFFQYDEHTFMINKKMFVENRTFDRNWIIGYYTAGTWLLPVLAKSLYGAYVISAITGYLVEQVEDICLF